MDAVRSSSGDRDVVLSVAEAAARVGLTPATLRTWDRRYGLAPSVRTAGGHRRYDAVDLARLRAVSRLVDRGVPAHDAVTAGLAISDTALMADGDATEPVRPTGPAGGGRVLPLPGGTDVQRGIARAARSLDGAAVTREVAGLIERHGVVPVWTDVLVPVLLALGERWRDSRRGVEIEHVAADGMARALQAAIVPLQRAHRPVLLACMPDEQHSLPLIALQAALTQHGQPCVLLGARVPPPALTDAVIKLRPRRLVLWAHNARLADPTVLAALPEQRPPLGIVLAGPGWQGVGPAGLARPRSLAEAVDLIVAVSG